MRVHTISLILILCCSMCCLLSCAARPLAASDSELLDDIIAVQSTLKTASGRITYKIVYTKDKDRKPEAYDAILKVAVPNQYYFSLKKDDQLEKFISNGKVEWHVEIIEDFAVDSKKELKDGRGKFSAITDYIPLRRENLEKHFKLEAEPVAKETADDAQQQKHAVINLTPLSADQKDHMKWTKIYFDKEHKVHSIKMLDANGNLYDILIQKMTYNVEFDANTFEYQSEE